MEIRLIKPEEAIAYNKISAASFIWKFDKDVDDKVEIPVKLANTATYITVEKFSLYANGGKLADSFTAKPMSPYIKDTSTGYDTAYENGGPYTLSTSSTTTVFIPVLPGTYNSVKLNYFYGETSKQVSLGNITVERGKITKVDETTVNPD